MRSIRNFLSDVLATIGFLMLLSVFVVLAVRIFGFTGLIILVVAICLIIISAKIRSDDL